MRLLLDGKGKKKQLEKNQRVQQIQKISKIRCQGQRWKQLVTLFADPRSMVKTRKKMQNKIKNRARGEVV
jgi:hypothetical protein